jgi:gamma-glutamyltranspeptidase
MLQTLTAPRGMVTAPHHRAAEAGLSILREGGNAMEAMVAAAAIIAVVYPHMNSIGGDGFWLIAEPGKLPTSIDACGRVARLATPAFYRERGYSTIPSRGPLAANTVAGAISGWQAALDLGGGKLPLTRLLRDAIWYASHGAPITANQVAYTTRFLGDLSPQPGFATTYLDNGQVPRAQMLRRYPRLAFTFEHIATRGLDDFYRGKLASEVADEFTRLGGPLRLPDLAAHHALIVTPLSVLLRVGTAYNLPRVTRRATGTHHRYASFQ